jgi:uncharacterized protein YegJ (DUF2314 family)
MGKLLLHVVSAVVLVGLGRRFGWAWWLTTGAVVFGAICVHVVFERLFAATRPMGAAAISNDDPLMLSAMEEAKRTWPQFQQLFEAHPKDSLVKFRLTTKAGDIENVWGHLLEMTADTAMVYLRTLPVGEADISSRRMTIPLTDIVDWQVMFADGSLRGGFTQQATFRIIEREEGAMPRKFSEELARYRPVEPGVIPASAQAAGAPPARDPS